MRFFGVPTTCFLSADDVQRQGLSVHGDQRSDDGTSEGHHQSGRRFGEEGRQDAAQVVGG